MTRSDGDPWTEGAVYPELSAGFTRWTNDHHGEDGTVIDTGDPRRDGVRAAMVSPDWAQGPCSPCAFCRKPTIWTAPDGRALHPFAPCFRWPTP